MPLVFTKDSLRAQRSPRVLSPVRFKEEES